MAQRPRVRSSVFIYLVLALLGRCAAELAPSSFALSTGPAATLQACQAVCGDDCHGAAFGGQQCTLLLRNDGDVHSPVAQAPLWLKSPLWTERVSVPATEGLSESLAPARRLHGAPPPPPPPPPTYASPSTGCNQSFPSGTELTATLVHWTGGSGGSTPPTPAGGGGGICFSYLSATSGLALVCGDGTYICVYYSSTPSIVSQYDALEASTTLATPALYTFVLGVTYGHPTTDSFFNSPVWYTNSITEVSGQEFALPPPPSPPTPPPTPPLPPSPPSPPFPSSWPGPFACCSGQASCGGVINDPVVCDALGDLYYATNGSGWINNAGWADAAAGVPTDYCGGSLLGDYSSILPTVKSIYCDDSGEVTFLALAFNSLSGTLPDSLGDLSSLTFLSLYSNAIYGSIPASLSKLTAMLGLYLLDNALTGTIPEALGSLTAVQVINLAGNRLSGTIPDSMGSLSTLTKLELYDNMLTGTIPESVGYLTALNNCYMYGNQLSGPIPNGFGSLSALQVLQLNNNNLSEAIPDSVGALTALVTLDLHGNALSGPIPVALASLTALCYLDLSSNMLSGPIPDALSNLILQPSLTLFRLDGNHLSGTVPAWFGNYTGPQLGLSNNAFSGNIPASLSSFPFNVKYEKCPPEGFNLSCSYFNSADGAHYIPILPAVGNVPGAFLSSCPAGTYRSGADTTVNGTLYFPAPICSPCLLGTVALLPNTPLCTPCPAGNAPAANASACSPCSPGSFLNASTLSCQACHAGSFSASPSAIACTACLAGYYSNAGASSCIACPSGTYLNATTAACQSCPAGTSALSPGSTACTVNPSGYISVTQSNISSAVSLAGVSAFGPAESAALSSSIAALLNVSVAVIQIASAPATARRLAAVALTVPFSVLVPAGSNDLLGALNDTSSFSAALVTSLQRTPNSALAAVTSVSVTPPTVATLQLAPQPCPAGTFLNVTLHSCQACAPGSYAPLAGAPYCQLCGPSTYALNATFCQQCPAGSSSPSGTARLSLCVCAYGFYQAGLDASMFACAPCPAGALCSGDATPLATEGFWHEPGDRSAFYACEDGFCLAERSAVAESTTEAANCRFGHAGVVCSVCVDGWTIQGEFCQPCPPNSSFSDWPQAKLGGIIFLAVFLFLAVTITFMLSPILQPLLQLSRLTGLHNADPNHKSGKIFAAAARAVTFFTVPVKQVVENIQIISSFKRTMHLRWPSIFNTLIKRLSFLNFNFLTLPSAACSAPNAAFYSSFNGVTIGVAGMLIWMGLLWILGRGILRLQQRSTTVFDRTTLSRIIVFLTLTYAPVTEKVLSVFGCRRIGEADYLFEDPKEVCFNVTNSRYRRIGGFWVVFYVFGVPALYLALMVAYDIPSVARELKSNMQLRACVDEALHAGLRIPAGCDYHGLTTESIPEEYLHSLWLRVVAKSRTTDAESRQARLFAWLLKRLGADAATLNESSAAKAGDASHIDPATAAGPASRLVSAIRRRIKALNSSEMTRKKKLAQLMRYAKQHLRCAPVTWHAAHGDPRLHGAEEAIGSLYREFYASRWYWILMEIYNKLIITGVLRFISPGTQAQVAAGMGLTFLMLLNYQRTLPYAEKTYRLIGYAAAIELYLFLVFAMMLSVSLKVAPENASFYNSAIGVLLCAVFVLPVILVARRLLWSLGEGEEGEELEEEEEEEKEENEDGPVSRRLQIAAEALATECGDEFAVKAV